MTYCETPRFFRFLSRIDHEFAAETRAGRCPGCQGPLHAANYPRKPRGCPAAVREEYSRRLSFTCGRCDARSTSPSVRFAGRRVYLAVVLMLRSPPGNGIGPRAVRSVQHPCAHAQALAHVVAGGFSDDAVLAINAHTVHASGRGRRVTPKPGEPLRERVDIGSTDAGVAMDRAVKHANADQIIRGLA